jgi:signal-transduction protein with cAMP-binding, CBS, and nucleotidyltransferase domain
MHDKILSEDISKFLINYPIFKIFPKEIILNILNNLSRKTIYKGEYLFHEGEESNNIYFLQNGTINLSFNISLAWFDDYLKYFNDSSTNMIIYLINEKPSTFSKIITEIEAKTKEINGKHDINLFFNNFDNSKNGKNV